MLSTVKAIKELFSSSAKYPAWTVCNFLSILSRLSKYIILFITIAIL
jgi:hypothetical protein